MERSTITNDTILKILSRRKHYNWRMYYGQFFQHPNIEYYNSSSMMRRPSWEEGPVLPLGITFLLAFLLVLLLVFRQSPAMTIIIFGSCLGSLCIILIFNELYARVPIYS